MSGEWIVCGWYTPDYRPWWINLRNELDFIGAPHDFVEVQKLAGGWEANTMAKANVVLDAIKRHPDKTIILLDVDCTIPGGLAALEELASFSGDVGFVLETKWRRRVRRWVFSRSGTMVFKPTELARQFVDAWARESLNAPRYAVDQDSLVVAIGKVSGLSITTLPIRYCAVARDNCPHPAVLHDSASKAATKAGKFTRLAARLFRIPQLAQA